MAEEVEKCNLLEEAAGAEVSMTSARLEAAEGEVEMVKTVLVNSLTPDLS